MRCPGCQQEVPADADFCPRCGARVAVCSACGTAAAPGDAFCRRCGRPLVAMGPPARFTSPRGYTPRNLAERILTSRSALEGERKTVTVLFCDLVGSTELSARIGPDAMYPLVDRFFEIVLREVHRYEGTVNQFLGDGFMALFGAPITYEDHARRAVLAALGIRHALADPAANAERLGVRELPLRMGLNTGPVVVGSIGDNLRMDYTAVGDTTNLAARMQQVAAPGEICMTESTHHAVERHVACDDVGLRTVKGRAQPIRVYRALHVRTFPAGLPPRPITAPMVGRDRELGWLLEKLEALDAGAGGIVAVLGEAGVGKSRLVAEARRHAMGGRALWLGGYSLSFTQGISYWPFLQVIRGWLGVGEDAAEADVWRRLAEAIGDLFGSERDDVLPYLATLLGVPVPEAASERVRFLDAEALGRQIVLSVRRLFERLARDRPLVLVLDDIQWLDGSSAELLEHLLPLTAQVPLLVCWKARVDPEGLAERLAVTTRARFAGAYIEIRLSSLAPRDARELIAHLMGQGELPPHLTDDILRKADGNPFFVEEVIHAMIDLGALARDEALGGWRATDRAEPVSIPDTIQGLVMARVDRLDGSVKQLLKTASVIGRSFLYRLVQAVADAQEAVDRQLGELVRVELIREAARLPELTYIFRHALVQEAAYESMLIEQRRRLHGAVAVCVERLFPDRLDEFSAVLAYHYTRAEQWEKAHEFLVRAGDQAAAVAADAEALEHYTGAFRAYERRFGDRWEPRQRAVLERKIGQALFRRGEHARAAEYLGWALVNLGEAPLPASPRAVGWAITRSAAAQLLHRFLPEAWWRAPAGTDDSTARERIRIYEMVGWMDYFHADKRLALDSLLAMNLAEHHGLPIETALGAAGIGIVCDIAGVPRVGGYYHRRAQRIAAQQGHPIAVAYAHFGQGVHGQVSGRWDEGIRHYRAAAEMYRRAGQLRGWGLATVSAGWLLVLRGEIEEGRELTAQVVQVGEASGDRQILALGLGDGGFLALHHEANPEAATSLLERSIELFEMVPDLSSVTWARAALVECLLHTGDLDRALRVAEEIATTIAKHRLSGPYITVPLNSLAAARLAALDRDGSTAGRAMFKAARAACRQALVEGRRFADGLPGACRHWGTYHWLRGRPQRGRRWWRRGLDAAHRLGARYEAGLIHLERGRRTGAREDVESAERLFAEIGDRLDQARARALLAGPIA
jgi:class 3 adenylate cyclase/tetratricopeptide (TPR) repeat protein